MSPLFIPKLLIHHLTLQKVNLRIVHNTTLPNELNGKDHYWNKTPLFMKLHQPNVCTQNQINLTENSNMTTTLLNTIMTKTNPSYGLISTTGTGMPYYPASLNIYSIYDFIYIPCTHFMFTSNILSFQHKPDYILPRPKTS